MNPEIERAISIVDEIEENNNFCCGSSTEPEVVELLCFELKEILNKLKS